jgi:DNA-binding IclR family transcriptional regulator
MSEKSAPNARPVEAPALDRGLAMLELLAESAEPLHFSRINQELGLNPATTSRLLRTLVSRGYALKPATGLYQIGPAAGRLQHLEGPQERLRTLAEPFVEALRDTTGNSALALWWSGRHTLSVAKAVHENAPAMQPLGRLSRELVGSPWTALALASLDAEPRRALVEAYEEDPDAAEAAAEHAELELDAHGCVFDDRRRLPGVRRLAAPLRGPGQRLVGMLALGGTLETMPDDRLPAIRRRLVDATHTLSLMTGGRPNAEAAELSPNADDTEFKERPDA